MGLAVEVVQGDALECPADVLAAGYSVIQIDNSQNQAASLKAIGIRALPKENEYRLLPGQGIAQAKHILLVGVPTVKNSPSSTVEESPYRQARYLGQQFLEALWLEGIRVRHLATTIHGLRINFNGVVNAKGGYLTYDEILAVIPGLEHNIDLLETVLDVLSYLGIEVVPDSPAQDDVETFRAMLLGLTDSYQTGNFPPELERITFMEKDKRLAMLLQDTLAQFLIPETTSSTTGQAGQVMQIAGLDSFRPEFRKPQANDATPHVFVAMPFKDRYDDQFYLAIQPCVKEAGFLCERMDLEAFTGDIVDRMFARIRTSRLTVALLDGGNPNVYLEVGYAWGVETPTILIAHEGEPLPFDVRGHRVLIYDKIYRLKQMLQAELERLLG